MNLVRKPITMEINGEEFELILDMESAINYQDLADESILIGIDKIVEKSDLKRLSYLIASCLKYQDKCVGMDFVKKIDIFEAMEIFLPKIGELMTNSLPKATEDEKKTETKKEI